MDGLSAASRPEDGKDLLRFITCGSVDDGKSTLIGRLLYDGRLLHEDQIARLERDSRRFGKAGTSRLDLALLVDGLAAEREQGITIDVAYRFFATAQRKFIVADTPGHEQYTRNMATGASTADLAVLLVDARRGVVTQTRRHTFILSLFGVRRIVLAVNKMDMVGWDQAVFDAIVSEFRTFATKLGIIDVTCIPLSALAGANVTAAAAEMPWYDGPPLLAHLEAVDVHTRTEGAPFRFPVQWVNRPDQNFRGFTGTVASGRVAPGDTLAVLPGGGTARVSRLVTMDGDLAFAVSGQAITIVLEEEVDIARGDMLAVAGARPTVADRFAAHLLWLDEQPLTPGRPYLLRIGTATATAQIARIAHAIDINTLTHRTTEVLAMNEVVMAQLILDRRLPIDTYAENRATGGFILIDRQSNATVACGTIAFPLGHAADLHWQPMRVTKRARASASGQKPCVVWFTGLSGAGKSSIADLVEQDLHRRGYRTMTLDGDNIRHGLNRDLGFADADRVENVRRVAEVAKLMTEAGLIVLVSFISPFRSERQLARELVEVGEFFEIFVDAPLTVCEQRDPKGLYAKARAGTLPNFTGISSPYEPPLDPELHLKSALEPVEALAGQVLALLEDRGIFRSA